MSYGNNLIGTAIATAYDTLGESGLQHSLNEPECVGIFTNAELLPVVANVAANVPSLRLVIYDGEAKQALVDKIKAARDTMQVLSIDELRALGKGTSAEHLKERRPGPEDVSCIMYTSGTTGPPKGVVIAHSNLVASVAAVYALLGHHLKPEDTYIAYLPLSHILEFVVELCLFYVGMTFGYGRVKTLTDASVRNCPGDIRAFKPSIMTGVPAVWEMIRKGIVAKINSSGTLRKSVFSGAYTIKKAGVPALSQLVDSAVFSQIKAATGGKLRLALSGGAALSSETQEFLSIALVTVLQGACSVRSELERALTDCGAFRLWNDRVVWNVRDHAPRVHAVQHCWAATAVDRDQAAGRARGGIPVDERPTARRSVHSWAVSHEGLLQAGRLEQ